MVPLGPDQRQVFCNVIEGLMHRGQGHAEITGELLGCIGVWTVDRLINDRDADAATLEEKRTRVRARARLQVRA